MKTFKPTAEQAAFLATMDDAARREWTAYYTWKAEEAAEQLTVAADAIRAEVKAAGSAEPAAVRRAVAVPARVFNEAIRYLKFTGLVAIDGAGLLVAA